MDAEFLRKMQITAFRPPVQAIKKKFRNFLLTRQPILKKEHRTDQHPPRQFEFGSADPLPSRLIHPDPSMARIGSSSGIAAKLANRQKKLPCKPFRP
jgi:hypothetical protein